MRMQEDLEEDNPEFCPRENNESTIIDSQNPVKVVKKVQNIQLMQRTIPQPAEVFFRTPDGDFDINGYLVWLGNKILSAMD